MTPTHVKVSFNENHEPYEFFNYFESNIYLPVWSASLYFIFMVILPVLTFNNRNKRYNSSVVLITESIPLQDSRGSMKKIFFS